MRWPVKRYSFEQEIPLPRNKVWELLSHTDRLNRFIKLFPVRFSPVQPGVLFREATATTNGIINLQWKEYPFQWMKNESYSVERVYSKGPLKRFIGGVEMRDSETMLEDGSFATRVTLYAEFTPANLLGMVGAIKSGRGQFHGTFDFLRSYLALEKQGKGNELPDIRYKLNINSSELNRLAKELALKPIKDEYIPLLRDHLSEQGDEEVINMQPYKLAYLWGADEEEVLRLCLYATKIGLLNLSWNMMCPNCRVAKVEYTSLSKLDAHFHCDLCGVDYEANFDQYVELRFSVHSNIRKASSQTYCIGGPFITPHIWVQKIIEQGETMIIYYPNTQDLLRLRVLKKNHILPVKRVEKEALKMEAKKVILTYETEGWSNQYFERPPSGTPIQIKNTTSEDIAVVLERIEWDEKAVTAAKVTTMQEFRDLFSSEVLASDQQVGIESVTILFSDLLGSTTLYESIGDAHAYGQVNRHFDFLTRWITSNSGSIVKTIGDAVMAVFQRPEQGIKASLEIQRYIEDFNTSLENKIVIKIGVHTGPAIAVNSNDRLDYFGRTVNLAARIQNESKGKDIVISDQCFEREGVQAIIRQYEANTESYKTSLRGIAEEIKITRIWL
jgi:adenylate cyclase